MRFFTVAALVGSAVAYPGMQGSANEARDHHAGVFGDIMKRTSERLAERQGGPPPEPVDLIGDLQVAGTGGTAVNDAIMTCFNDQAGTSCLTTETYTPPAKGSPSCAEDTCCIWSYIAEELAPLFQETDGTCNDLARSVVRFGFHDAGAWAQGQAFGGADGSLLLSLTEVSRSENAGLDVARNALLPIYAKYKAFGISAADLVQFAHNVAVLVCPLGPRFLTYVGRPEWNPEGGEDPTGLLPSATSDADTLLNLFLDKTIQEVDLVALIGAHTTAKQFFFDTTQAGLPLDSTPGVWDVSFYAEVLNGTAPCGVFRLPSDTNMGADSTAVGGFNAMSAGFPSDTGPGQILWNGLYAKAYLRLSLLGVAKIQNLTDCSKVLPSAITTFEKPADAIVSCKSSTSSAISSTSSAAPSSTKTYSSFSHWGNSTASYKPTSVPGGKGGKPTGGKGGKPTSSYPAGGKGGKPTGSYPAGGEGGYGGKPTGKNTWSAGAKPTDPPYYPGGSDSGSWGKTTKTIYTTKTITFTDAWGHLETTTTVSPVSTSVCDDDAPWKATTTTVTHTSTITLHGGKVTTSVWEEPVTSTIWDPAWTVVTSAAPVKTSACVVKTVTVTTTAWA